jgi:hypothetical protein
MADTTTTAEMDGSTTQQTAPMEQSGGGNEQKTFTQEQVNRMIQERLARAKHEEPADYAELKAKAAKYDELEDAKKTELERITEQVASAQKSADEWQTKFEELQAQRQHELDVHNAATTYGVDADVLMRMGGDVEENAKLLQAKEEARPKFGSMRDGGEKQPPAKTLDEMLKGVKSTAERIRIRERWNAEHDNK